MEKMPSLLANALFLYQFNGRLVLLPCIINCLWLCRRHYSQYLILKALSLCRRHYSQYLILKALSLCSRHYSQYLILKALSLCSRHYSQYLILKALLSTTHLRRIGYILHLNVTKKKNYVLKFKISFKLWMLHVNDHICFLAEHCSEATYFVVIRTASDSPAELQFIELPLL